MKFGVDFRCVFGMLFGGVLEWLTESSFTLIEVAWVSFYDSFKEPPALDSEDWGGFGAPLGDVLGSVLVPKST